MSMLKNTVLLLKSEKTEGNSDKYEDLLKLNNFEVILVKTLSFQYKNIEILGEKLLNPDNFTGVIFSSPRCVNAASQALFKEKFQELWKDKFNFAVGQATHDVALEKLGVECNGKESGNAKNLAHLITQNCSNYEKPFLFPHGNLKTDTLKTELAKENLKLEEVLVYDTLPNPEIESDLAKATDLFTNIPEFIVFFSPSGLHSTITYLRRVPIDFTSVKIIAIGPVTELAVQEENLKVYKVAKNPTPEDILKCIM